MQDVWMCLFVVCVCWFVLNLYVRVVRAGRVWCADPYASCVAYPFYLCLLLDYARARVLCESSEWDLALLTVDEDDFWSAPLEVRHSMFMDHN
jgi:hypothetical protein